MTDKTFDKYKTVIDQWFINGFNGTKAYQKFYPNANEDTSAVKFNELVRIGKIQDYIQQKKKEAQDLSKITHEKVLEELKNWAYSDITETILLTAQEVKELPKEVRRLVTKFKHTKTTSEFGTQEIIELHFVSKEKAIDMINKHIGFYGEHNFQKNPQLSTEERNARLEELKKKMREA
ncbi:MAG: terminase small subunit [Flavobacteriaceae bacterium]|nr:terminase small subunit [Flavobacteriaceae bacterium]